MKSDKMPETIAAGDGMCGDSAFGAVAPALYMASSYRFPEFGKPGAYEYSRTRNPTRDQLGETLAKLEGGAASVVVASGMAAVNLVLSGLEPGDEVVAPWPSIIRFFPQRCSCQSRLGRTSWFILRQNT